MLSKIHNSADQLRVVLLVEPSVSWPMATRATSGKIYCPDESVFKYSFLLGLLAKIKVFGVLPAHWPLILDEGTVLESIPLLICAGFANCHCTWSLVI